MNRREFLQCAAVIVSGVPVADTALALSQQQLTYLAAAPNYNAGKVSLLDDAQRKVLAAACEIIIPRTDTPGAIDAGVPRFVELMAADWMNEQERAIFLVGMRDLQARALQEHGKAYDTLAQPEQLSLLEALEDAASDSSWYDFGNAQRDFVSDAPFICQLKELTVWGFFTSELGATQVLRYEAMPMSFDGHYPYDLDDSSWSGDLI